MNNIIEHHPHLLCFLLILPVLYAETHYRFKYFFSWLRKDEPEIIADIPSRVNRGRPIPILLIIKDANLFPATIISVRASCGNDILMETKPQKLCTEVYQEIMLYIESGGMTRGLYSINIQIIYECRGQKKICYNDNHRGTSHDPLILRMAESGLPRLSDCVYGEPHAHTNYTSDQVEFGASLHASAEMSASMDFDFLCATDHSYDLDDYPDNYLKNDPDLTKWKQFNHEVRDLNRRQKKFVVIPGEEVTVRNSRDKNVHCLVYNSQKFYPGSGDGAERWFKTRSELSVEELLDEVEEQAVVFAAHPAEPPPFLQRLFIARGTWNAEDCRKARLDGLQFINGGSEAEFIAGKKLWVDLLLSGNYLNGLAGNDAHGNFARYRQIGFPFFTMRENYLHLFGKWRTGVYLDGRTPNIENILASIKQGNCFMTNGPALRFRAITESGEINYGTSPAAITGLIVEGLSSDEYSAFSEARIFIGNMENQSEELNRKQAEASNHRFSWEFSPGNDGFAGYARCEIITKEGFQALSNPIWFNLSRF